MSTGQHSGADDLVFRLQTERDRSSLTIRIEGRLDRRSGHYLVDTLEQLTIAGDDVTIDLTLLNHMDRHGARALARSTRDIRALGAQASISHVGEQFRRLLAPHGLAPPAVLPVSRGMHGVDDARRRP